jgi:hypothetical protein
MVSEGANAPSGFPLLLSRLWLIILGCLRGSKPPFDPPFKERGNRLLNNLLMLFKLVQIDRWHLKV